MNELNFQPSVMPTDFYRNMSGRVLVTLIAWHFVKWTLLELVLSGNSSAIFLVALSWFFAMRTSMRQRPRTQLNPPKKPENISRIIPQIDAHKKPCASEKIACLGPVLVRTHTTCVWTFPNSVNIQQVQQNYFRVYPCIGIAGKQSPICHRSFVLNRASRQCQPHYIPASQHKRTFNASHLRIRVFCEFSSQERNIY